MSLKPFIFKHITVWYSPGDVRYCTVSAPLYPFIWGHFVSQRVNLLVFFCLWCRRKECKVGWFLCVFFGLMEYQSLECVNVTCRFVILLGFRYDILLRNMSGLFATRGIQLIEQLNLIIKVTRDMIFNLPRIRLAFTLFDIWLRLYQVIGRVIGFGSKLFIPSLKNR